MIHKDKGQQVEDFVLDISSETTCLKGLKCLGEKVNKTKNEMIYCVYFIGQIIKHLKTSAPQGCELGAYLHMQGIKYSDSYCRALVSLHDLINRRKNLLRCCLSIRTLIRQQKLLEEICVELGW